MKRLLSVFCCFLLILTLCSCSFTANKNVTVTTTRIDADSEENLTKANPQDVGMDPEILKKLGEDIPKLYPQINSTLILRHGNLVFEEYYNGTTKDSLNQIRSVTKSFLSALIGIAQDKGDIKNIDLKAAEFFPEYSTSVDEQFHNLTIKHLLSMTSGIPYDFNKYRDWIVLDNQIKSAFESKLVSKPGVKFRYNDPGAHMLSGILTKATKMTAAEYADKYLFNELGITKYDWPKDNQGNNIGAAELTLRTRDMAKLGQLYLNKGKWKDKQIVSEDWVNQSTSKQSQGGPPSGENYGYLWWVTKVEDHAAFFAMGYGGQFIYVVPDLDVVCAITTGLEAHHEENRGIIQKYVVPAIKE